jgi:hypothetical protein
MVLSDEKRFFPFSILNPNTSSVIATTVRTPTFVSFDTFSMRYVYVAAKVIEIPTPGTKFRFLAPGFDYNPVRIR